MRIAPFPIEQYYAVHNDEPGHVRVGCGRANMPGALERFGHWIDTRS